MKKIYGILIALFIFMIPIYNDVYAKNSGINKFYMDAIVEKDGSILVKEAFSLNGTYNGFERIIATKNENASSFNPNSDMYGGSSIHNASDLELVQIKGAPISKVDFNSMNEIGVLFNNGIDSEYKYNFFNLGSGYKFRIYNPSSSGMDFYLEYRLKNMAILHEDIAELGWNIFSNELVEDVEEFQLLLHIPENKNELRAWAHGPLNGNIEILDKQTVKVTISDLAKNTSFDVRLVFDKDVISNSIKKTGVSAFDKILKYEQVKANEANKLREQARIKYYGVIIISAIWLIGFIVLLIRTYLKYDKEYKSNIKVKYFREFPNTYGPEVVGYLMNHKIGNDDLSAAIMNLIYLKVITVEKVMTGKKEDYKFTYHPEKVPDAKLTVADTALIKWLFDSNETLNLSTFKSNAQVDYESFLDSYETWKGLVKRLGEDQQFFLEKNSPRAFLAIYSFLGFMIGIITSNVGMPVWIMLFFILASISGIIYSCCYQKRTPYGNDEYVKWKAFKNFLLDFGNFSAKELPEIILWEKYLVYAVTLGCANKLAKQMEIKVKEVAPMYSDSYPTFNDFYIMSSINRSISSGVSTAVTSAISTRAMAQSKSSSGSGFGGGFSSGGGSFGGGGGGGRF